MSKQRLLLMLILVSGLLPVADAQNCDPPTANAYLFANNVEARLGHGGILWEEDYFVPGGGPDFAKVSAMRNGFLWMGGVDEGGNLKVAADWVEGLTTTYDYSSGPLYTSSPAGTIDPATCQLFNNHWPVSESQIELFRSDFEADGDLDQVHLNVLQWPGSGNPYYEDEFGIMLPAQPLAPFEDLNGNGIYEPYEGEYPVIKGDEASWWVINDNGNLHFNSGGAPLQFEISILAYAYASEDEDINNTTFYELTMYNRAIEPIDSIYAALAVQTGLGCPEDDYFGSIPGEDIAYVYNADDVDGVGAPCSCPDGANTYCQVIPTLGFKFLETPENTLGADRHLANFGYINNLTGPSKTYKPSNAWQYYQRIAGRWNDESPYYDEGPGTSAEGEVTNYVFTGNPATAEGQNLCTEELLEDRRTIIMSTGPYYFAPGESGKIVFAVYWMDNMGDCVDQGPVIQTGNKIEQFYETGVISSATTLSADAPEVVAIPNPGKTAIQIKADIDIQSLELFDLNGQQLRMYTGMRQPNLMIERGDLPAGVYLYRAMLNNGQVASGKLMFVD